MLDRIHDEVIVVSSPATLSDAYALTTNPHMLQTVNEAVTSAARAMLKEYVQRFHDAGFSKCSSEMLEGHAGEAVVEFASQNSISMVVVGRTGCGALKRMFKDSLGSTSGFIASRAPCSVLVVHGFPRSFARGLFFTLP